MHLFDFILFAWPTHTLIRHTAHATVMWLQLKINEMIMMLVIYWLFGCNEISHIFLFRNRSKWTRMNSHFYRNFYLKCINYMAIHNEHVILPNEKWEKKIVLNVCLCKINNHSNLLNQQWFDVFLEYSLRDKFPLWHSHLPIFHSISVPVEAAIRHTTKKKYEEENDRTMKRKMKCIHKKRSERNVELIQA